MPGKGTCPVLPPPPTTGSLEGQPPATSLSLPLQPTDFSFVVFEKGETVSGSSCSAMLFSPFFHQG